jgi:hypothetical protein
MKNYYDSVRSERQLKSLTGLGKQEFEKLLQAFSDSLKEISDEEYRRNRKNRSRRPGGGRKGQLSTPENKLFFILFYLKTYPTFDVLGFFFVLNPSKAEENVKKLLPVLKRAQSKLNLLPRRILKDGDELKEALETVASNDKNSDLPAVSIETHQNQQKIKETQKIEPLTKQTVSIDVTEREHFRHKNNAKQKKYYSGKKKRHTVKNTIVSDSERRVIFLGRTFEGSTHDYKMFQKEFSPSKSWFSNISVCVDLGYQGIKTDYSSAQNIHIPNKKPKKSINNPNPSLSRKQKAENKKIGSKRVIVEHAIGGMKAFHILSRTFRNRTKNMVNEVIFQVAGLWNLKILC